MTTRGIRYGIPGDYGKRPGAIEVVVYGCAPPDALPPDMAWPWPAPEVVPCPPPIPVGGVIEAVRQRLAEARQSRATLDAEIETLEKMIRAAGVEP
jgi:hypothetical protein